METSHRAFLAVGSDPIEPEVLLAVEMVEVTFGEQPERFAVLQIWVSCGFAEKEESTLVIAAFVAGYTERGLCGGVQTCLIFAANRGFRGPNADEIEMDRRECREPSDDKCGENEPWVSDAAELGGAEVADELVDRMVAALELVVRTAFEDVLEACVIAGGADFPHGGDEHEDVRLDGILQP